MAFQTIYTSQQPVTDFGLPFSSLKYSATLAATTDTTLVVPSDAQYYKAIFVTLADAEVFVTVNKDALVPAQLPAGASLTATNSELIQNVSTCREVKAGEILHFITPNAATPLSVILYVDPVTN